MPPPALPRAYREALLRRFPARVVRRALATREMLEIVSVEDQLDDDESLFRNLSIQNVSTDQVAFIRNGLLFVFISFWVALSFCMVRFASDPRWVSDSAASFELNVVELIPDQIVMSILLVVIILTTLWELVAVRALVRQGTVSATFSIYITCCISLVCKVSLVLDLMVLVVFLNTSSFLFYTFGLIIAITGLISYLIAPIRAIIALYRSNDFFGFDSPSRLCVLTASPPPFDWIGDPLTSDQGTRLEDMGIEPRVLAALQPNRNTAAVQLAQSAGICGHFGIRKVLCENYVPIVAREVLAFSGFSQSFLNCFGLSVLGLPIKVLYLSDFGYNDLVVLSIALSICGSCLNCSQTTMPDGSDSVDVDDSVTSDDA